MPGHRHASHSRRSRSRSRSSHYSRHSCSSRRSRRTPSPAASVYSSSSDRSLSPPAVEAEYLRRRLLCDRKEDKTAKATRAKEKTAEPQSGKGLGVMCIYPGCTAPVMYTQSWKNHMIKAHLKTTGEKNMKHHSDSYEVAVDSAVLLNTADNAKRMLMFRIGNLEHSLDRLTQRFETEIEAVMAPLMSELYERLSKRLDARPRSPSRSRSPPPRSRTHAKRRYDYDDHHSSSPKVPRHSRSASVRTVFEATEDTSMEVVEEDKAPVPTAAAEQLVHMATSTPAVTSTPAPTVTSTPVAPSAPAAPAPPVQTPMPAPPAKSTSTPAPPAAPPVQTPTPVAPPTDSTPSPTKPAAPAAENQSEEEEEEDEPAPTSKPGPQRTPKQSEAARTNLVKGRRNKRIKEAASQVKINRMTKLRDQVEAKLKAATEKFAATVATLASASDGEQAAIEAEIAKLEAEVQKRTKDLKAIKLDLGFNGAASSAHTAVMFSKDVAQELKEKENAVKAATKKANARQSSAERAAAKAAMEIAVSEYEAFSRVADEVDDAVEAVAVPVGEAVQADQLTKDMVEKALQAAHAFEEFSDGFNHDLLKPPQPPAQSSEEAGQDVEL
ncbi:hypothetical protein PR003_g19622 [Phytophthora rubi]|uniref:Uncharacterized protein n=1 Tax=Phytophthora rubi TaxID=129364 RepID=A0A6A4DRF2_9STRA|nr:hypothetical protein PR001_g19223 [Phytophthora rubi]KAE9312972.1 hypothetical protein PR003_g19622 [Phytophthora rubi]